MEKLEIAKTIGEKIIESRHDFFVANNRQDLSHTIGLKRIITAVSKYLNTVIQKARVRNILRLDRDPT